MWADGCIWLIDLGMVGRLDDEVRQQLMLLLLAFAQGDGAMLAELALDLAGGGPPDLDRDAYEAGADRARERAPGSGTGGDPVRRAAQPAHRPVDALRRPAPGEPRDGGQGRRPGAAHRGRDRAGDRPARRGGALLRSQPDAPPGEPARSAGAAVPGREAALPRRARRRGLHRRAARAAGRPSRSSGRSRTRAAPSRSGSRSGCRGSRSRRASARRVPPPWGGWHASSRPRRPRRWPWRSPAAVSVTRGAHDERTGRLVSRSRRSAHHPVLGR